MLKYCKKCVMPNTKPDLSFNEGGVCSACTNFENRIEVNWQERRDNLEKLLNKYRSKGQNHWDCIIPVSGGKDSTYQVIKMLELNMTPLCVTGTTCDLSEIGKRNIENIKDLGVDHVQISSNPVIRKKLNKIGLTQVGDISWAEHLTIFTTPVRAAVQFNVPLLIWGENGQNEYGGPASASNNNILDRRWLEEFGGLLGLRPSDLIGLDGIEKKHLMNYFYPTDNELNNVGVTGIFLGHYMPWDGISNALIAQANGFESLGTCVEGSMVDYENLDNHQTGIHDYFKYLKFGFGRATDIACLHLRRGRLQRNEAIQIIKRHDGKFPWTCLGKPLDQILKPLDIKIDEFIKICDKFTNKIIFQTDSNNQLIKDKDGNLFLKNKTFN